VNPSLQFPNQEDERPHKYLVDCDPDDVRQKFVATKTRKTGDQPNGEKTQTDLAREYEKAKTLLLLIVGHRRCAIALHSLAEELAVQLSKTNHPPKSCTQYFANKAEHFSCSAGL